MRSCRVCGQELPSWMFPVDRSRQDGLRTICKPCAQAATARWRAANPDKAKWKPGSGKRWPRPAWKRRDYYRRHRDAVLARNRGSYERHRGKHASRVAEYRAANPDKLRLWRKVWNARRRAVGRLTPADVTAVFERWGHACIYCGTPDELTIDHVVPIVRGGTNDPRNLRPACMKCNRRKNAKDVDAFLASLDHKPSLMAFEAEVAEAVLA